MYMLTYVAYCPNIPEYHGKVQTLTQTTRANAMTAYAHRRNNSVYRNLRVHAFLDGAYTDVTEMFNYTLDKKD